MPVDIISQDCLGPEATGEQERVFWHSGGFVPTCCVLACYSCVEGPDQGRIDGASLRNDRCVSILGA